MSGNEVKAEMETAWTIALINDPALRALMLLVDHEHAKMLWSLGYMRGKCDGYAVAQEIMSRAA